MTKNIFLLSLITTTGILAAIPAQARDLGDSWVSKERFQIRARVLGVLPDEDSDVNIGGDASVGDAVTPELDLTYFITPHIALEAIAATAQHKLTYTGDADIGDTWILPPTVTLQYHFTPDSTFSPYVGAGVNYSYFYGEESGTGFDDLDVEGGFGWALQAGADIWMNENWGLNLDVKKLFLDVDAKVNAGGTPVRADVDLDPWIVGAGVSFRF
ncbi:MAG: OmpW family protein [Micavibrio aeruginosavorus]|uniref:OmpW family protein n=1 Tax=Micavibrio aeruginosavorus TaxID=349221 RepID=A0A2W5MTF1_9BACT|nr:MAG: OmpW family protein [Micavibrio aeruginosavorus]